MVYIALITLDLPGATGEKREKFDYKLRKLHWEKIIGITTTWKANFAVTSTRREAEKNLRNDLLTAKSYSGLAEVDYAFQLGKGQVIVNVIL